MKAEIKKLWRGCIDLRDYNVKACLKRNSNYTVVFQGEVMTLTPKQLMTECTHKHPMKSAYGESYELWSYIWKPDE